MSAAPKITIRGLHKAFGPKVVLAGSDDIVASTLAHFHAVACTHDANGWHIRDAA